VSEDRDQRTGGRRKNIEFGSGNAEFGKKYEKIAEESGRKVRLCYLLIVI